MPNKDPEKRREYSRKYYAANRDRLLAYQQEYREEIRNCPSAHQHKLEYMREWRKNNPDRIREYDRTYRKNGESK